VISNCLPAAHDARSALTTPAATEILIRLANASRDGRRVL
jgi:hypothetical protein